VAQGLVRVDPHVNTKRKNRSESERPLPTVSYTIELRYFSLTPKNNVEHFPGHRGTTVHAGAHRCRRVSVVYSTQQHGIMRAGYLRTFVMWRRRKQRQSKESNYARNRAARAGCRQERRREPSTRESVGRSASSLRAYTTARPKAVRYGG
jgi:hypothetical protein